MKIVPRPKKQVKKMPKQDKKKAVRQDNNTTRNPSVYLAVTLVVSVTIMLFTFIIPYRQSLFPVGKPTPQATQQIDSLKHELDNLKDKVDGLSIGIKSSPDIALLNAKVKLIDKRLTSMENSIAYDSNRAVELTLLHKEVEQLVKDLGTTREDMKRNFDLFQFFLGSIALTFFVFVVNYLFTDFRNKSKEK